MQNIPKIDLSDFLSGNEERKKAFIHSLGRAYEEIGFVAVKNHGISDELINELYLQVKAFFELPTSTKQQYEDNAGGQRGYTSFGKEHAKHRTEADLKEFWHFGQYVEDNDPIKNIFPANKEVKEIPAFNVVGKNVFQGLENTGKHMLRAIALYLKLDENYFDKEIHNGNSILRPIHYPPITQEPSSAIRAGEHEDINLITLLVGASAEGLEVLNKQNEWIPVTKVEDCIVVNVGDMLQRLTNDKLRSTTHRVVNPPREKWHTSRYSIPFFLHPRPDTPLNCLKDCISVENPKRYEDITAGEFLNERLREIGLLK